MVSSAFILYRQHWQAAVVAQNPGLANPDISKIIGEQWRKLAQESKDEWKALAEVSSFVTSSFFLFNCHNLDTNKTSGGESSSSTAISRIPVPASPLWPGWKQPQ